MYLNYYFAGLPASAGELRAASSFEYNSPLAPRPSELEARSYRLYTKIAHSENKQVQSNAEAEAKGAQSSKGAHEGAEDLVGGGSRACVAAN